MPSQTLLQNFFLENDPAHRTAMADAQTSILASLMLLGGPLFLYFTGVTFLQADVWPMTAMSLLGFMTSAALFYGHFWLQRNPTAPLPVLERIALAAEILVYVNVLTYVLLDFQSSKVFYLVLMPIIFSVASVTIRLTVASVGLSLATLAVLGRVPPLDAQGEHVRLVAATSIIVLAIFLLFRRVLIRQVHARTLARRYARELERQASLDPLNGLENRPIGMFVPCKAEDVKANADLEGSLAKADLDAELFLVFQPQVELETGKTAGFEALVRWNSPQLGLVPPDRFIRSAERQGLIKDITRVVLRKGLAVLSEWPADITLSFNISAQNASDAAFLAELLQMIRKAGVAPSRVDFEITETAILPDPDAARKALATLAEAGCGIALDDFGVGYSSLQHLRTLPLNKVKIDRSFVRDASVSKVSLEIIAAVIALCRQLGLDCVLEGVETEAELSLLAPLGPNRIQGYLFGRPMDAAGAFAFLADGDGTPTAAR